MLNLDLTDVKEQSFGLLPDGIYTIMVDEAEVKQTKSGDGEYINCKFKVIAGEYEGRFLFKMFNIKNANPKAVEIGLGEIKSFMRCANCKDFNLKNAIDLIGLKCNATVKTRSDSYGYKNVIAYFRPLDVSESVAKAPTKSDDIPF